MTDDIEVPEEETELDLEAAYLEDLYDELGDEDEYPRDFGVENVD